MPTKKEIKGIRELLGETQQVFAQRFGVDQTTVHRWEKRGLPARGTANIAVQKILDELRKTVGAVA